MPSVQQILSDTLLCPPPSAEYQRERQIGQSHLLEHLVVNGIDRLVIIQRTKDYDETKRRGTS